jgi:PAS domain-containing protein
VPYSARDSWTFPAVCAPDCGIFETCREWRSAKRAPKPASRTSCSSRRNRAAYGALGGPEAEYQDVAPSPVQAPCPVASPDLSALHALEKSLNPAEIDQLRGRILTLEVENARLKASVAAGPTPRREAEAALADSEARYRTLFKSIDKGFCIIEFFEGPHSPLSDYVHVEANAAYELHAGIPNAVGRKLREMVPDEADGWAELFGVVLRTGKPIRFERELVAAGRHLEPAAFRVEPESHHQRRPARTRHAGADKILCGRDICVPRAGNDRGQDMIFNRQSSAVHAVLAIIASMGRLEQPGTRMFNALLLDKRGDTQ